MDEYPDSKYERDKIGDSYKSIQQGQLNIRARKVYALYKSEYALRHLYAKLNAILLGAINDIIVQHTEGRIAMLKIGCAFANFNVDARKYELNIVGTDIGEEIVGLQEKKQIIKLVSYKQMLKPFRLYR